MRDRDLICEDRADRGRFWVPYTALEEFHAGMWKIIHGDERQAQLIAESVAILRSRERFATVLARVLEEWPVSCRAEFTSPGNHLAWMGQAACCYAAGVPEGLTRRAWWKLTEHERAVANGVARTALSGWRQRERAAGMRNQLSIVWPEVAYA